ncbi:MAG: hypothetical protein ACXWLY_11890 [Thermoanaerobaculia bacterium]
MASNPPASGSVELWVSLDGNDGATGTRGAPFRTLRRATRHSAPRRPPLGTSRFTSATASTG